MTSFILGEGGNVVRDKLDCCPVTIKVSSFIVKTPNRSQSIREIQHSSNKRTAWGFHGIPSPQQTNTSWEIILNDPPNAQQWMFPSKPWGQIYSFFCIFVCFVDVPKQYSIIESRYCWKWLFFQFWKIACSGKHLFPSPALGLIPFKHSNSET